MPCIAITGVAQHILDAPSAYPGPHNSSHGRTDPDLLPLDPRRQLLLIWDCMCDWVRAQLENGRGSFTFERSVKQLPAAVRELNHVGKEVEVLEPCFIMAPELAAEVIRHHNVNKIEKNFFSCSIFQTKNMRYLNPVAVAAACYLDTKVVASAFKAFFSAIRQLVMSNYDLILDCKFCVVRITNKKMSYSFEHSFKQEVQAKLDFRRTTGPARVKDAWSRCSDLSAMACFIGSAQGTVAVSAAPTQSLSRRLAQMKRQQVDDLSHVSSFTISRRFT
ncbi:hypothetical protein Efla_004064 [Eimeria flavescens]